MKKSTVITSLIGLAAVAIGTVIGAKSKKVQCAVAAGETAAGNAWDSIKNRFKKQEVAQQEEVVEPQVNETPVDNQ